MTAVHTAMLLIALTQGSPWQNGIVESFNGRLRDEARLLVVCIVLIDRNWLFQCRVTG